MSAGTLLRLTVVHPSRLHPDPEWFVRADSIVAIRPRPDVDGRPTATVHLAYGWAVDVFGSARALAEIVAGTVVDVTA